MKCLINYSASVIPTIKCTLFLAHALFWNISVAISLFIGDLEIEAMPVDELNSCYSFSEEKLSFLQSKRHALLQSAKEAGKQAFLPLSRALLVT